MVLNLTPQFLQCGGDILGCQYFEALYMLTWKHDPFNMIILHPNRHFDSIKGNVPQNSYNQQK